MGDNVTMAIYYGLLTYNTYWPEWSSSKAAAEPLVLIKDMSIWEPMTFYTGTTRGFFATLDCEQATILDIHFTDKENYLVNTTYESPSCTVEIDSTLLDLGWRPVNPTPERSFFGDTRIVRCQDGSRRLLASVTLANKDMELVRSR